MNSIQLKENFLEAVDEAMESGARLSVISDMSGISRRSIQRWRKDLMQDMRKGSIRKIPHKLTEEERRRIIAPNRSKLQRGIQRSLSVGNCCKTG